MARLLDAERVANSAEIANFDIHIRHGKKIHLASLLRLIPSYPALSPGSKYEQRRVHTYEQLDRHRIPDIHALKNMP